MWLKRWLAAIVALLHARGPRHPAAPNSLPRAVVLAFGCAAGVQDGRGCDPGDRDQGIRLSVGARVPAGRRHARDRTGPQHAADRPPRRSGPDADYRSASRHHQRPARHRRRGHRRASALSRKTGWSTSPTGSRSQAPTTSRPPSSSAAGSTEAPRSAMCARSSRPARGPTDPPPRASCSVATARSTWRSARQDSSSASATRRGRKIPPSTVARCFA